MPLGAGGALGRGVADAESDGVTVGDGPPLGGVPCDGDGGDVGVGTGGLGQSHDGSGDGVPGVAVGPAVAGGRVTVVVTVTVRVAGCRPAPVVTVSPVGVAGPASGRCTAVTRLGEPPVASSAPAVRVGVAVNGVRGAAASATSGYGSGPAGSSISEPTPFTTAR